MRDTLDEAVRPENPVFDVAKVNKALVQVNFWIDEMSWRNDALGDKPLSQQGSPGEEFFIEYLAHIMYRLSEDMEVGEDGAYNALAEVLDYMEGEGLIEPLPVPGDPDIAFSQWVGQAKTANLEAMVRQWVDTGGELPVSQNPAA